MFHILNGYTYNNYMCSVCGTLEHPAECRRPAFCGSLWREMTLFYILAKIAKYVGDICPQSWGHLSPVVGTNVPTWGQLSPPGDKCPHVGTNVPKWGQLSAWGQMSPRGDKCPQVRVTGLPRRVTSECRDIINPNWFVPTTGDNCPHLGTIVPARGQLSPLGDICPRSGTFVPARGQLSPVVGTFGDILTNNFFY